MSGSRNANSNLLLFVFWLLGFAFQTVDAFAQDFPSVIEEVKLVTEDDDQSTFILRFSPEAPPIDNPQSGVDAVSLNIRSAFRAPALPEQLRYQGLVRQIQFQSRQGSLAARFATTSPAQVKIEPLQENSLQVRIQKYGYSTEPTEKIRPEIKVPAEGKVQPLSQSGSEEGEAAQQSQDDPQVSKADEHYEMIMLRYADVSEVIGLLSGGTTIEPNNVFIRRAPGFGSLGSNNQSSYLQSPQQEQKSTGPLGQSFENGLAVDRRLNAIWVTGTRDHIERVRKQIDAIDVPVDSVILETQFVELTETGARNLGIDLNNNAGQIAVGKLETGNFLPYSNLINSLSDVLPSGALQAAIYAQVEKGEGRILSRPRIAAQSGSTAKIITGDALPILTSITLSGVNGVSQQVQYVNVGVTLQIAPRVTADGFVTSQIYGVVSSVTGYSQGYPTISQREAETSASVRDGETFVIGGLTQENAIKRKSKVPLLGDIPLMGNLFQQERSTRSKTELYIVITPRIVRHKRSANVSDGDEFPPRYP